VLDAAQINGAKKFEIYVLETLWFENDQGKFKAKKLPLEAQFAPVQAISVLDFNDDGLNDLLLLGNLLSYRVEYGPMDASRGVLLKGDGKGSFAVVNRQYSGLDIEGEVKDVAIVNSYNGNNLIFLAKNNAPLQVLSFVKRLKPN
jgi:hypothetical protein